MNIKYISPKLKESFTEQFMKHLDSFCCYMRVKYDRNCYVRPPVLWLVVWDCAAVAAWRWCRSVTGLCRDIPGSGLVRPDGWCHLTQSSGAGTCVRILHHVDRQPEPRWWKYLIIQHFPVSVNKPGHGATVKPAVSDQDRLAEAGRAPHRDGRVKTLLRNN